MPGGPGAGLDDPAVATDEPPSPPAIRRAATAPGSLDTRACRGRVVCAAGKHQRLETCLQQGAASWRAHRRPREEPAEERAFLHGQVKQHNVCSLLGESDVGLLLETVEFFSFTAGQTLLRQGDVCQYFFVVHSGFLEVVVEGRGVVHTMHRGDTFGGSALLFDAPQPVSVIAKEDSGVWGLDGNTFRQVLKADAQMHLAENCKLLDSIRLLDVLSQQQKARISEVALFSEVHEVGSHVIAEGEEVTAIRVVKSGKMGVIVNGSKVNQLQAGDSFGKSAALHKRVWSKVTITAETHCELVCVGIAPLRAVLGPGHGAAMSRALVLRCLEREPRFARLPAACRRRLAEGAELADYAPGERIHDSAAGGGGLLLVFAGTVDGVGAGAADSGVADAMGAREVEALPSLQRPGQLHESCSDVADAGKAPVLRAATGGAHVATLEPKQLAKVLHGAAAAPAEGTVEEEAVEEEAVACIKAALFAGRVPAFQHLARDQVDGLVQALRPARLAKADLLFENGEAAAECWVVEQGELEETAGGKQARTINKNGNVGIDALLLHGPRRTTVRVLSDEALLWRVDGKVFDQLVTGSARQELIERFELRDTDVALSDLRHVRVIGTGGFGSVRLVEHKQVPLQYALKRVRKQHGHAMRMVARECALLAELDHPFILLLVKTFEKAASTYILTELVTGGELLSALDHIARPLTRSEAQFYTGAVLLVLEFLHDRSIVFRDLKPENVLLDAWGYVKLIDFGTAKKLDRNEGRTFTRIGSYHFMAPEVVRGRGYGSAVDLWSLGVMLFEFVCGYLPFGHDIIDPTGVEICRAVQLQNLAFPPRYLDRPGKYLLRGLLSKEPETRLGAGAEGTRSIRDHEYFAVDSGVNLFEAILRRQLPPPYVSSGGDYPANNTQSALSDASEFE